MNEDDGVEKDGGVDEDAQRQSELDAIAGGADALTVLKGRLSRSQAELNAALKELRAVMSDEEVLDTYGIDLAQLQVGSSDGERGVRAHPNSATPPPLCWKLDWWR